MTFQIEKNIPLPEAATAKRKYPFDNMAVGDSFMVNSGDAESASRAAWSRNAATRANKVRGYFAVRRVDANTVRIWRVE